MSSSASTSAELAGHLAYLEARAREAIDAPLSARQAMLCALLADRLADRLFEVDGLADDRLAFRAALAADSSALALVFDLAAMRPDGPRLVTEAVEIPLADYGGLTVEDFMVSLYNDHSVQRLRIASPDGTRHDVHAVLGEAVATLAAAVARA